jgi:hypothetical protein
MNSRPKKVRINLINEMPPALLYKGFAGAEASMTSAQPTLRSDSYGNGVLPFESESEKLKGDKRCVN